MPVLISDLWVPQIWIKGVSEKQATFPVIWNSGAVVRSNELNQIASGGGITANVPFFKDMTDQNDEVQVENTGPSTDNGITSGIQIAPILNRVTKNSATALSAAVSGADPVGQMTMAISERRAKQRQKTLIALLRGAFGTSAGAALGNAAELAGVRITAADETGVGATASETFGADLFINAKALLGELANELARGALFCHSNILASLEKSDAASFKSGVVSGLPFTVRTYREVPVFVCDSLVRAGTTNGSVYDTYILGPGVIGYGDKPQTPDTGDTVDVATLQFDSDKDKNNQIIYDRTRFLMHLNGMKWVGTPAAQSATNAELGTLANWDLAVSSASRVGAVCIVTNA